MCKKESLLPMTAGVLLLLQGCVTQPISTWSATQLQTTISSINESCRLKENSGFTAELTASNQGSARLDAAWDKNGNLNGQVVNPLGEDVLNFRVDSSGVLQTDVSINQSAVLGTALEFLAELGTQRTRLLLCSGLYLAAREQLGNQAKTLTSEVEFDVLTRGNRWNLVSSLQPTMNGSTETNPDILVSTNVSAKKTFFKQSVAKIEWVAKVTRGKSQPKWLFIQTNSTNIKLLFLDFE